MINISVDEYKRNPCGSLAAPYWKYQAKLTPGGVRCVHARDWTGQEGQAVPRYFRLSHTLEGLAGSPFPTRAMCLQEDLPELTGQINLCHASRFSPQTVASWMERPVFRPELWRKIVLDGKMAASGIGEYDPETGEGVLEWIQVDPDYRRRGFGRAIVLSLLAAMAPYARLATVSGSLDNPSNPERLYRACGFTGDDVWYIVQV